MNFFATIWLMLSFAFLCLFMLSLLMIVAEMLKPSRKKPKRIMSFKSSVPANLIMKAIIGLSFRRNYRIEYFDEGEKLIILGDSISWMSLGYFYPIYIEPCDDGMNLVEIGIRGKANFAGTTIGIRYLEHCFYAIKASIFNETASIGLQNKDGA